MIDLNVMLDILQERHPYHHASATLISKVIHKKKEFFSHTSPSDKTAADRLAAVDLKFRKVGENLAMTRNVEKPAKDLVDEWMESPSHWKNILDADYTDTGLGIWKENDRYYFTQIFLQPWEAE